MHISTRPSYGVNPPTNRRSPVLHLAAVWHMQSYYDVKFMIKLYIAWQLIYIIIYSRSITVYYPYNNFAHVIPIGALHLTPALL